MTRAGDYGEAVMSQIVHEKGWEKNFLPPLTTTFDKEPENPRLDRGFRKLIGMSLKRTRKPSRDKIKLRFVNCNKTIIGG